MPEHAQVLTDAAIQADEQRMADERMANRDFLQMRQRPEKRQVVEVEVMPGVYAKTQRVRELCRRAIATE